MGSSLSSPDEARKVRGHVQNLIQGGQTPNTTHATTPTTDTPNENHSQQQIPPPPLTSIRVILKTPLSQGDLFAAFGAHDAILLRDKNFEGFKSLVRAAAGIIADDSDSEEEDEENRQPFGFQVLNAARILHRTLALVWELPNPHDILTESEQSRLNGAIARRLLERDLCRGPYALLWTPILGEGDEERGLQDTDVERDCNRIELLRVILVMASKCMWGPTTTTTNSNNSADNSTTPTSSKKPDFEFTLANDALIGALVRSMFGVLCSQSNHRNGIGGKNNNNNSILPSIIMGGNSSSVPESWSSLADACVSSLVAILSRSDSRFWPSTCAIVRSKPDLIIDSFVHLISSALDPSPTSFHCESISLLWLLLDGVPEFRSESIQKHPELVVDELLPLLLLIIWNHRRCVTSVTNSSASTSSISSQVGLVQMATFIIMVYSSERQFSVSLNRELINKNPLKGAVRFNKYANHFDLLCTVIYKLIFDSDKIFEPLHRVLLTILLNVSPFVQELGKDTATRLLQIFERISKPKFLLEGEDNNQHVFFMLEIFNNLIQYGKGQGWLLYALVRSKHVFEELKNLTLTTTTTTNGKEEHTRNNKFFPTPEWLDGWKSRLSLSVVDATIQYLEPLLIEFCKEHGNEDEILEFVESQSLVGVIPVPHPISIHRYRKSNKTDLSVLVFFWSTVFMRASDSSESPWEAIDESKITLFRVKRKLVG
jgi:hypothetical protein